MTQAAPPKRAAIWLRVSTDNRGQDPELQLADLERVCQQRSWTVVTTYRVEESAFGRQPRERFEQMLEDARRARFDVIVCWSMDRFSREGAWSVSRIVARLMDWGVHFYSYNEPFLDTTGMFAPVLIPLFAWLAQQESIRKGRAVKLGLEKARAAGKTLGRPAVGNRIDVARMVAMHKNGSSWSELAQAHRSVTINGKRVRPSRSAIRRAVLERMATEGTNP